ncbi:MAG: hypothetical protein F4Z31_04405 [Gemmatimonadetes bacterium]|nr:hypothetical protein [bacterium]MYA40976.1 hypothetical protein [Gemmatimonadota bacterium]MYE94408.1 hypothetical protein [Gemmatimonadota bacterium]MYJ09730.1 hypothetical protein [Gemmatimonadota bacterium]
MKKFISAVLVAAWLTTFTTPRVASAAMAPPIPMTACALAAIPDDDPECDKYLADVDVDVNDEGDIHIDITLCKLKKQTRVTVTIEVETDEGTESVEVTILQCEYGDCTFE